MKLSDAIAAHLKHKERLRRSPKTIENFANHLGALLKYLGDRTLARITLADLRGWSDTYVSRKYSPHSHWSAIVCAQAFFNWCVAEELLTQSPAKRLEKPKLPKRQPRYLEEEIILKLLAQAYDGEHPKRDNALLLFMLETGVRRSGVANLRLQDLHLKHNSAVIVGKGDMELTVYFDDLVQQALADWLCERNPETFSATVARDCVFGLSSEGIYHRIKLLADRAQISVPVSPHRLRHSSAVYRVESGVNETSLQQIMGWQSSKMAAVYTKLAQNRLARHARRTSPVRHLHLSG